MRGEGSEDPGEGGGGEALVDEDAVGGGQGGNGAGEPGAEFFDGGVYDFVFLFEGGGVGELELGEALFEGGEGSGVEVMCGDAGIAMVRLAYKYMYKDLWGENICMHTAYRPPSTSPPLTPNTSPTARPASTGKSSLPHL